MKRVLIFSVALLLVAVSSGAWAATVWTGAMYANFSDYPVPLSSTDLINGLNQYNGGAVIEAGGFHWAFPDGPQLTDGVLGSGTDSVLQDFAPGNLALQIRYILPVPTVLAEIRSFGGNPGRDGRVFQDLDVEVSPDGVNWLEIVHEAITAPFYTSNPSNEASLIRIYDDAGPLVEGVPIKEIRLKYWLVDNSQNWFLPRTEGGLNTAPIIKEIDVLPIPEPSSILALAGGAASMAGFLVRRKRSA